MSDREVELELPLCSVVMRRPLDNKRRHDRRLNSN